MDNGIDLYTTCLPYHGQHPGTYLQQVREISRWSDAAGCKGMLIYTDNSLPDPWLISQIVIQSTASLEPLVAVQPVYMHPYTVAKMVSSLSMIHGRRICLNMVAGGFTNDLKALADCTPHDRRYDRLTEYTTIIQQLLAGTSPVTFVGEFYQIDQVSLKPCLPKELYPTITLSGSSDAGLASAATLGAIAVKYPEAPHQIAAHPHPKSIGCGFRIGIIARESKEEAWRIADERFPSDRAGQIAHGLAMKASDSVWHHTLSASAGGGQPRGTYWLGPFENYKTFCPYLVGNYEEVAACLALYLAEGFTTIILDIPSCEDDLAHIRAVLIQAQQKASMYETVTRHTS
jgi:alkanesulfonate monooxygenase